MRIYIMYRAASDGVLPLDDYDYIGVFAPGQPNKKRNVRLIAQSFRLQKGYNYSDAAFFAPFSKVTEKLQ